MSYQLEPYKTIIWDFDGVILDSGPVRTQGFEQVLTQRAYKEADVKKLVDYHLQNGGLSRYAKFEYFLTNILPKQKNVAHKVQQYAMDYKKIMLGSLQNPSLLINDSLTYIKSTASKKAFYIASGSDQIELRTLCKFFGINVYFKEIFGSPTPKNTIVANILDKKNLDKKTTCLIGDSINDYEAAAHNGIDFFAYNNIALKEANHPYIPSFCSSDLEK